MFHKPIPLLLGGTGEVLEYHLTLVLRNRRCDITGKLPGIRGHRQEYNIKVKELEILVYSCELITPSITCAGKGRHRRFIQCCRRLGREMKCVIWESKEGTSGVCLDMRRWTRLVLKVIPATGGPNRDGRLNLSYFLKAWKIQERSVMEPESLSSKDF